MKRIAKLMFLSLLVYLHATANAADDEFMKKIWNNEKVMKSIDKLAFISDQEKYVFYIVSNGDYEGYKDQKGASRDVILYKIENKKRKLLFRHPAESFDIVENSIGDMSYEIVTAKNSLYITQTGAHHGVWGVQYQFKAINGVLTLIGSNSYYSTLLAYSLNSSQENSKFESLEYISGESKNHQTKQAASWAYIANCSHKAEKETCDINNQRAEKYQFPKKASAIKNCSINDSHNYTIEEFVQNKEPKFDRKSKCNFTESELIQLARRSAK
jgi:hypothetical protein